MATASSSTRSRRDVLASVAGSIVCSAPVFLVGSAAVQIRASLHFSTSRLGFAVALFYLGAGASAIPLGRVAEAIGGLRMMRIAALGSGIMLLLVALVARSWLSLALVMVPAGVASAAMQPAVNLFLTRRIAKERQGLAFGLKQSSVPLAAMLGGLAVPSVALTLGWRWSFVIASAAAVLTALLLPRPRRSLAAHRSARQAAGSVPFDRLPVTVFAVGFGLGVAAAGALNAFIVSSAVAGGVAHATAGYLAAFGGAVAAASRILNGRLADRRTRDHLRPVATLLAIGGLGYGALALISAHHLLDGYFPVIAVVFAAGWGWNGLLTYTVVRTYPDHPARATGITQAGGRLGGMVGPLAFGLIVDHASYALAWLLAGGAALLAAGTIATGHRLMKRRTAAPAAAPVSSHAAPLPGV